MRMYNYILYDIKQHRQYIIKVDNFIENRLGYRLIGSDSTKKKKMKKMINFNRLFLFCVFVFFHVESGAQGRGNALREFSYSAAV